MTRIDDIKWAIKRSRYLKLDIPETQMSGFIHSHSKTLLAMTVFDVLHRTGYSVVKRKFVKDILLYPADRSFVEHVIVAEGYVNAVVAPHWLLLNSTEHALDSIQQQGELVLLTLNSGSDSLNDFEAGEILTTTKGKVRIRPVTSDGKWRSPKIVRTELINRIDFGTSYLRALQKYAKSDGKQ
jgi:hypothetical protein